MKATVKKMSQCDIFWESVDEAFLIESEPIRRGESAVKNKVLVLRQNNRYPFGVSVIFFNADGKGFEQSILFRRNLNITMYIWQ